MKKAGLLLIVLMSVLSITLVSAETNWDVLTDKIASGTRNIASGTSNVFSGLQLDPGNFTLILVGILVWMVVYSVIRQIDLFKKHSAVWSALFALIVTVLAFYGFPPEQIKGIVLNFKAMGGTIATIIPFLIIFWFTTMASSSLMVSRIIWVVYVVYFFSLFFYKIGSANASIGIFAGQNLPYVIAIIAGIIVLIFLGVIRAWAFKEKLESKKEKASQKVKKMGAGVGAAGEIVDELSE